MTPPRSAEHLRSHRWFGRDDLRSFGHRSRMKQMGFAGEDFHGKPVIAIVNTWSELTPCHVHLRQRADDVKRGVWQAGGFPVEVPALSLSEPFMKPSTMLYRNLLAMEVEEILRAHPVDGAVLLGGCDKTTPALLMGATSVNLPALFVPAGPMLRGTWRGTPVGSGTDVWRAWNDRRAGVLSDASWNELEDGIARSFGHCMTMGTASTMTSAAEAMGWTLPGASSIPAPDAEHARMATASGRRAVEMVWEDLKPRDLLTRSSVMNGIRAAMAIGGSTNATIHLIAMAGRAGIDVDLDTFDAVSRAIPVLANLQPSGDYLMEDFYYAGGLRALLDRIRRHLDTDCTTVNGRTLGENLAGAEVFDDEVIRTWRSPVHPEGAITVLRGNLAPAGCVLKRSAASPHLLSHTGRAVVFRDYDELTARIDADDLDVEASSVLVLQNAGPVGGPGMPEWGMLPIPKKLLERGVRDMVRISDARMSGTSFGTCVLHVSPESFVGGPLGLVRDGDRITLDVPRRMLRLCVDEDVLERRRANADPPRPHYARGYGFLHAQQITQAHRGCDFACLHDGPPTVEPAIH